MERRKRLDALGGAFGVAADVRVVPVAIGGIKAEWSSTPGAHAARVILFLHGGGYCSGSLDSHRHIITEAGRSAARAPWRSTTASRRSIRSRRRSTMRSRATASSSTRTSRRTGSRSPATAPAAASPSRLMVALRDAGMPLPACAWCISPWIDLEAIGDSMASKAAIDPMISKPYVLELASAYLGGADPRIALAAPLYADLARYCRRC